MQYSDRKLETMFEDTIDECQDNIKIGSLEYLPSLVLKRVDPVAYRCGLADYIDSLLTDEIIFEHADGTYHDEPEDE